MKFIYSLSLAALLSTAAVAQNQTLQQAPPSKPLAPQGGVVKPAERYPNIMDAQKALENAKMHLQKAPHDFGGHRSKAVEYIDHALAELNEAIKWNEQQQAKPATIKK